MGVAEGPDKPISLFYSYSHDDEDLRGGLERHLSPLRRHGLIAEWHDRMIEAGDDWKNTIDAHLNAADVILLLVSASFINSDYVWNVEMKRALERHDQKEARVIPVILKPCLWFETPMSKLQAVPEDAKPITTWQDRDEAFLNVAMAVRNCIARKPPQDEPAQGGSFAESQFLSQMTSKMINASSSQQLKVVFYEINAYIADHPNSYQARLLRDTVFSSMQNQSLTEGRAAYAPDKGLVFLPFSSNQLGMLRRQADNILSHYPEFPALLSLREAISHVLREPADFAVFRDIDAPWCPEMVALPAGEFLMGSSENEEGRYSDEGPQHRVTIDRRFAIGRYAVTFDEYDLFCAATTRERPEDAGWGRSRRPVINVSWRDAVAYCAWLANETGRSYRLPSEAEWEYAARAGTTTRYAFGDAITPKNANYRESKLGKTTEVDAYPPNAWGLHDMHGNVWEWVEDIWHDNYQGAPTDGTAWVDSEGENSSRDRVGRGGSWGYDPRDLRSAVRGRDGPVFRSGYLGFRVARTLELGL